MHQEERQWRGDGGKEGEAAGPDCGGPGGREEGGAYRRRGRRVKEATMHTGPLMHMDGVRKDGADGAPFRGAVETQTQRPDLWTPRAEERQRQTERMTLNTHQRWRNG